MMNSFGPRGAEAIELSGPRGAEAIELSGVSALASCESANGPLGFGVWYVPSARHRSCQRSSISFANSAL